MKRAISMLGAVAAIAVGFLFAAPAANAQSALQTISNGGVTCKEYASTGGSQPYFPNTFRDCINTGSALTSGERLVGSQARFLPTSIKTALAGVQVMIFQNAADFASFTGTTAPDSKYVVWTANSGPGALSVRKSPLFLRKLCFGVPTSHLPTGGPPALQHAFRDNAGRLEISAEVRHRGYFA